MLKLRMKLVPGGAFHLVAVLRIWYFPFAQPSNRESPGIHLCNSNLCSGTTAWDLQSWKLFDSDGAIPFLTSSIEAQKQYERYFSNLTFKGSQNKQTAYGNPGRNITRQRWIPEDAIRVYVTGVSLKCGIQAALSTISGRCHSEKPCCIVVSV